jgi:hypothetical protein
MSGHTHRFSPAPWLGYDAAGTCNDGQRAVYCHCGHVALLGADGLPIRQLDQLAPAELAGKLQLAARRLARQASVRRESEAGRTW